MSGWRWDETLFAGAARYYERGRLPYDEGVVEAVRRLLARDELAGSAGLLDVGCGPGTLTRRLAILFPHAVGVDPDRDMIATARAALAAHENIEFRCQKAEDMQLGQAEFAVATFGQSFHWMERERVAGMLRRALVPGGFLVLINNVKGEPFARQPTSRPAPPRDEIEQLVRLWLGPIRRAGQYQLPDGTPDGEEQVIAHAGFEHPQRLVLGGGIVVTRSVDDLVAELFSRSDAAPHLFGPERTAFEAALRDLLEATSDNGYFDQVVPATEMRIWTNPGP
jgi:SAM-dependent methyltransferase